MNRLFFYKPLRSICWVYIDRDKLCEQNTKKYYTLNGEPTPKRQNYVIPNLVRNL
jgi:hypothetical protein